MQCNYCDKEVTPRKETREGGTVDVCPNCNNLMLFQWDKNSNVSLQEFRKRVLDEIEKKWGKQE